MTKPQPIEISEELRPLHSKKYANTSSIFNPDFSYIDHSKTDIRITFDQVRKQLAIQDKPINQKAVRRVK